MKPIIQITKALSDSSRIRILGALGCRGLCVCQIVELLKLAHSTVSRHLSILNQAGLVESHKSGRWMHYRLPRQAPSAIAAKMTSLILKELETSEAALQDRVNLKRILRMDTEKLCSIQKRKREG